MNSTSKMDQIIDRTVALERWIPEGFSGGRNGICTQNKDHGFILGDYRGEDGG
jgi:hypothetical protein